MGILLFIALSAALVITSSVTLVTSGLTSKIAANENQHLEWWIPFSVGDAGGMKFELILPANATFIMTYTIFNSVSGTAVITGQQSAAASVGNALAAEGTYFIKIDASVFNGDTAGLVDLQVAQNSSNADSLTILKGSKLLIAKY